jgi:dipeptidyl-peptidase-4
MVSSPPPENAQSLKINSSGKDNFPLERAITHSFRCGVPRSIRFAKDHHQALFLRSDAGDDPVMNLWRVSLPPTNAQATERTETQIANAGALTTRDLANLPAAERTRRERLRESSSGITDYSSDVNQTKVCFTIAGSLWLLDLATLASKLLVDGGVSVPMMDPTGTWIVFLQDSGLNLISADTSSEANPTTVCAEDDPNVTWGAAEFLAAEEMGRYRGVWWAPDGQSLLVTRVDESPVTQWSLGDPANPKRKVRELRYPAAGTPNADVQLVLVSLQGAKRDVAWDHNTFEYLTSVSWSEHGPPLMCVQPRDQSCVVTMEIDPRTGTATELSRRTEPFWSDLIAGVPRHTPAGIVDTKIDVDSDTRRLVHMAENRYLTPPGLQVRAVVCADKSGITIIGSDDVTTQDLFSVDYTGKLVRLSNPGGWAVGSGTESAFSVTRADPSEPKTSITITASSLSTELTSLAAAASVRPKPQYLATGQTGTDIAVFWPTGTEHRAPIPIIMSPYGGPHAQRVIKAASAFLTEQWIADQGFCVIVADGPGTPRTPSFERSISGDLASGPLQGQVDALEAVIARFPNRVDSARVGIRGWSFGGYLAALALLERPDLFRAAVAGAPVTEWGLYDSHYTERYLGTPQENPASYAKSDLIARASALEGDLLLVHGLSDDNVFAAHTLRLSSALLAAGKAHSVLPLTGVSHMTPQEAVAENLLRLDVRFLQKALQS